MRKKILFGLLLVIFLSACRLTSSNNLPVATAVPTKSPSCPYEYDSIARKAVKEIEDSGKVKWLSPDVTMSYYTSTSSYCETEKNRGVVLIDLYPIPNFDGYTVNFQSKPVAVFKNGTEVFGKEAENAISKAKEMVGEPHLLIVARVYFYEDMQTTKTELYLGQP